MQDRIHRKTEIILTPIPFNMLGKVYDFARERTKEVGIDLRDTHFNEALEHFWDYCRVAHKPGGEIYTLFFPDTSNMTDKVVSIHAFVGKNSYARVRDQEKFLREYIKGFFENDSFDKIEIEVLELYKMIRYLVERTGFLKEGIRRKRWYQKGQAYDILLYGLLKDEWKESLNE